MNHIFAIHKMLMATQTNNATVGFAMDRLEEIVFTTVDEINQCVKEISADGNAVPNERQRGSKAAIKELAIGNEIGDDHVG
ncbi:MAG: hypothetical protein ACFFC7_34740, partial [Candidatus Hermodarchaeota archaeon]